MKKLLISFIVFLFIGVTFLAVFWVGDCSETISCDKVKDVCTIERTISYLYRPPKKEIVERLRPSTIFLFYVEPKSSSKDLDKTQIKYRVIAYTYENGQTYKKIIFGKFLDYSTGLKASIELQGNLKAAKVKQFNLVMPQGKAIRDFRLDKPDKITDDEDDDE